MKTISTLSVIVVLLWLITVAPAEESTAPPDFRQARWGMTQDEIRKTESTDRLIGDMPALLLYDGEIAGIRASIFYLFGDNGLARGLYSVETLQQDTVISDYQTIRAYMIKTLGPPVEERLNMEEDGGVALDPEDPEDRYTLTLQKIIEPEIIWTTPQTKIFLRLTEKDGRVAIQVDYIPLSQFINKSDER